MPTHKPHSLLLPLLLLVLAASSVQAEEVTNAAFSEQFCGSTGDVLLWDGAVAVLSLGPYDTATHPTGEFIRVEVDWTSNKDETIDQVFSISNTSDFAFSFEFNFDPEDTNRRTGIRVAVERDTTSEVTVFEEPAGDFATETNPPLPGDAIGTMLLSNADPVYFRYGDVGGVLEEPDLLITNSFIHWSQSGGHTERSGYYAFWEGTHADRWLPDGSTGYIEGDWLICYVDSPDTFADWVESVFGTLGLAVLWIGGALCVIFLPIILIYGGIWAVVDLLCCRDGRERNSDSKDAQRRAEDNAARAQRILAQRNGGVAVPMVAAAPVGMVVPAEELTPSAPPM